MTTLQHPDPISSPNLHIWRNNAAFDTAAAVADAPIPPRASWRPLQPIPTNRPEILDLLPCKENRSPVPNKTPDPSKKSAKIDDSQSVDAEIEGIEREISRLSARLDALRIKKSEAESKTSRRGRVVPAKFMQPKGITILPSPKDAAETPESKKTRILQRVLGSSKNLDFLKKIDESPAAARSQRRGVSLCAAEIQNGILGLQRPESTPLASAQQSRRKSCYWKLEGIGEERKGKGLLYSTPKPWPSISKTQEPRRGIAADRSKQRGLGVAPPETASSAQSRKPGKNQGTRGKEVKDEKGRSMSMSPRSRRRSLAKMPDLRKGVATTAANKSALKEDDASLMRIKPKTLLFEEAKNPVTCKKQPLKNMKVRVVPSRYSLATARGETGIMQRKLSLPEPGKEGDASILASKRSLSLGGEPVQAPGKALEGNVLESSPPSITKIVESLPKIRTSRCNVESPRNSGPAKRVAELIGRKSYFGAEALVFEEDE